MKQFNLWFILALIAVLAMTCASQLKTDHTYTVLNDTIPEHDTIKLEDILLLTDHRGVMYFDTNKTKHLHGFTGDSIIHYYGYLFDVGEHNELKFQSKITTNYKYKGKITTYFYSLYHKGYFCKKVAASFGEKGNQIFEGSFSKFDLDVNTNISITNEKAILIAKAAVSEKEYAWEKEGWEAFARAPNPILTIHETEKNKYQLTYTLALTVFPFKIYDLIIDANTGEILRKRDASNYCNGCQNCNNEVSHSNVTPLYYNNLLESIWIKQCSTTTGQCNKLEQTNHHKIIMFDNLDYNMPPQEVCWETGNPLPDNSLLSAYWATETTYDYLSSNFGYHGYDGTNTGRTVVKMVGHPTISGASNYFNPASSVGQGVTENLTLTLTAGVAPNTHSTSLDVIGHEIAHGIDNKHLGLKHLNDFSEGNIILEGLCDILGIAVESTKKASNDWEIGNDFYSEVRHMNNPNNSLFNGIVKPQPDTYNGAHWMTQAQAQAEAQALGFSGNGANLFMHHNNGFMNYWFYLLVEGGSGTNDNGLGYNISPINTNPANQNSNALENAMYVVFKTMKDEFKNPIYPVKDFQNLRKATMAVAENEYGCNSNVWETVRQAWDAVGVMGASCEEAVKTYSVCTSPSTCVATITTCGDMNNPKVIVKDLTTNTNVYNSKPNGILTLSNLVCGRTYKVTVKDKSNPACEDVVKTFTCQSTNASGTTSSTICPPSSTELEITPVIVNNCDDDNNINLSVTGGVSPYSYLWSNGSNSQNLTNIVSGTYTVTLTDACYNSATSTVTVNGYPALNVSGQAQPLCNPTDLGSIDISVSGGQTPYSYNWSNGATTQDISGLAVGSYSVTVTDGNGCAKSLNYYIGVSSPTIHSYSVTASCPYNSDGHINLGLIGGTAPYTYQWQGVDNTQTIQDPIELKVGQHCVTVTDANGCTVSGCYNIPQASYTYTEDLINCTRIYNCNGNQYSRDMYDYDNTITNYDECSSTIPCQISGGNGLTSYGTQSNWFTDNNFWGTPECQFECWINGTMGIGDAGFTADEISTGDPCGENGTWVEYYCNDELVGGYCDEPLIGGIFAKVNPPIGVYPNPFINNVTIKFNIEQKGEVNLKLFNITGQELWNKTVPVHVGENQFIESFGDLSSGIYFLNIEDTKGIIYRKKLIRQ